jgi:hypothetical protein
MKMRGYSIRDRLLAWSIPEPNSGCWLWLGALFNDGYGAMTANGKCRRAHRISYQEFVGPIPDGLHLLHSCDVPTCINPDHLRPGTPKDNKGDQISRNRHRGWSFVRSVNPPRLLFCKRGHDLSEPNIYWSKDGGRHCRQCTMTRAEQQRARKRAERVAA